MQGIIQAKVDSNRETNTPEMILLKFKCQKTGKCCKTPTLFIPVTHRDLAYLYKELDEDFNRLVNSLAFYSPQHQTPETIMIYEKMVVPPIITSKGLGFLALKKKSETSRCIFLKNNNLCSIYKSRPLSCLLYPITFVEVKLGSESTLLEKPCRFNNKEACLQAIGSRNHVHAVFSKASLSSCLGIGKGSKLRITKLIQMSQVFYRDLEEFRAAASEINSLAEKGELLSPREVISVLLVYGFKKNSESSASAHLANVP